VLNEDIYYEITFNSVSNVIVSTKSETMNYTIKGLCLEYDTIYDEQLANSVSMAYQSGKAFLYDYVSFFKKDILNKADKIYSVNINIPRRSIKGILLLFENPFTAGERNSETFPYVNITRVDITVEGIVNKIYSQGFQPYQHFQEAKKFFLSEIQKENYCSDNDIYQFYGSDKYCLWLDLRTTEDNNIHGSGYRLVNTKDGIQMQLTLNNSSNDHIKGDTFNVYIFVIADAQLNIVNKQVQTIMH
jgi:hypothetical protein